MEYIIISTSAAIVAALTFFTGFGLGTLLMPAFALFFSVNVAIAATAVVHLANNLFKFALIGRNADFRIVVKFAVPASISAALGAFFLHSITVINPIASYNLGARECTITPVKLVIASLIFVFAVIELVPRFNDLSFDKKYIPVGGVLSGFFGGLSGHQGALRTAFLIRAGMPKEVYIGTIVTSAIIVDISRLIIYGFTYFFKHFIVLKDEGGTGLIIAGACAAFMGSLLGRKFLSRLTMKALKKIVGVLLFLLAFALAAGIV